MRTWADNLTATQQQRADARAAKEQERRDRFERRHTPMHERIKRVIAAMPEDERPKPRELDFFVRVLAPKWFGRRAAAREVADGLRALGWERRRTWVGNSPGEKRYATSWHPPEPTKAEPPAKPAEPTQARAAAHSTPHAEPPAKPAESDTPDIANAFFI